MPPSKKTDDAPADKPARRTRSTQKYLRNLYGTPAALKLKSGERIELRPRGQRGDLVPLTKEQEKDGNVLLNLGLLVEVISEAEAAKIVLNQTTNQQAYHPAMQILRDEHGNQYTQTTVTVTDDPQQEGTTVALLKDGEIITERQPGKGQQMVRKPKGVGPTVATNVAGGDNEMASLLAADDAARNGSSVHDILGNYDLEV